MTADTVPSRPRVAVLGNGPVGQTTALLLARWGIPVVVLDARAQRDPIGSKAICQQGDVLEVWDAVGIGRQVADEGITWERARTFYRDRELFERMLPDRGESPFPPFVNISQTRVEELLDAQLTGNALVDVRWGHAVQNVSQDQRGTLITCATANGPIVIEADYCVVALGSRADRIRQQLGVSFDGRSFDDRFLVTDIQADIPGWEAERRFYFDPEWNPGRQVLIHPCPDSTFRIDWQVPGDYDLDAEEADGGLDTRVRCIIGDIDYRVVWRSVYRFQSRVASRLRVGRVLLAGDTAHVVSPFGARGLNTGVFDADNAAWKLAFVLRGWAGESLLETYHDERYAAARENLDVTTTTMDFLVPQNRLQTRQRERILSAAQHDRAAWPQVDSGRMFEPFWYVDSPLVTPDPARPFTGRPELGTTPKPAPGILVPDVFVRTGDHAQLRLRQIAREGLLLLTADGVDVEAVTRAATAALPTGVRVHAIADIDATGALARALQPNPGEVWIIRPDAYIAAVAAFDDLAGIDAALNRTLGRTSQHSELSPSSAP
ncbi:FAD-dependent monooxygenase [Mycobacterium sp. THU-M104]|uniref:FAD-dependent monooxygenase n=1 Tax=Mycobacterium sp. THU-M104 TaxID=3410515 RepID=UPI003B9AD529